MTGTGRDSSVPVSPLPKNSEKNGRKEAGTSRHEEGDREAQGNDAFSPHDAENSAGNSSKSAKTPVVGVTPHGYIVKKKFSSGTVEAMKRARSRNQPNQRQAPSQSALDSNATKVDSHSGNESTHSRPVVVKSCSIEFDSKKLAPRAATERRHSSP